MVRGWFCFSAASASSIFASAALAASVVVGGDRGAGARRLVVARATWLPRAPFLATRCQRRIKLRFLFAAQMQLGLGLGDLVSRQRIGSQPVERTSMSQRCESRGGDGEESVAFME